MKQYKNTVNTSTHITKTYIQLSKHPHIQNPHVHTPAHYKTHTYTHPHTHIRKEVLGYDLLHADYSYF